MKLPFIKFFPRDWMGETALQCLGYAARGLWIEIICLMSTSERYGYLIFGGKALTPQQIALMTRGDPKEVEALLDQLIQQGVCSVCRKTGAIYCRRMASEFDLSGKRSAAGRRGALATHGRTSSKKETTIQISESRVQNPDVANDFATANDAANDLANGVANATANLSINPPSWNDVEQAAEGIGIPKHALEEFFAHFESVGWITKHGQPLRSLKAALKKWALNSQKFAAQGTTAKTDNRKGRLS